MFAPVVTGRRSKKDAGLEWDVVVPARRTLTGKRITRKDVRRVTRRHERKRKRKGKNHAPCSSNPENTNREKNAAVTRDGEGQENEPTVSPAATATLHKDTCDKALPDGFCVKPPGRRRAKARKRLARRVSRAGTDTHTDNTGGDTGGNTMGTLLVNKLGREKKKKRDDQHAQMHAGKPKRKRRIKAVRPRSKNKSNIAQAMTGKKNRKRKCGKDDATPARKTNLKDLNVPQGPHEHTRVELETFTKQRLSELRQEQLEVGALHCRITEMEAEAAGMTARHLIHQRRELQKQIEEMRDRAHKIESGDEINDFCRDAARFFYTFDRLQQEEKDVVQEKKEREEKEEREKEGGTEKEVAGSDSRESNDAEMENSEYMSLDDEGLAQRDAIVFDDVSFDGDGKHDSKERKAENGKEAEEDTDILRPEGTVITEEERITREQVPALVMPDHIQDMIQERQRQVAKPDLRVMTRGRGSSTVCADSFLEKFGSVHKPLCTLSDEQCSMCGTGQLVLDVVADVLVCENCRHEQTSNQSSDRNVGYNNAKSMHYSACRYRRITHFVAHLDRLCGCVGSSKLTPKLLSKVMQWLRSHNVERVKISDVEDALKDMGYNKLTNHKVVITARITGIKPPRFTPDERYQMIEMFLASEPAFAFLRRTGQLEGRLNYLNYTYTMYKFVEVMSWGHRFLKYFRLLRGKENLAKQDRYWRKVCKIVGLPFIRSV